MTRGKFFLITNDKVYISTEFNGDMYPDGHGLTAKKMLDKVTSVKEFVKMIEVFNKQEGFDYEEELVHEITLDQFLPHLDFGLDYFDFYFSDWIFIKNISDETYDFMYRDPSESATLKPNELLISNFGHKPEPDDLRYLGEEVRDLVLTITLSKSTSSEDMATAMEHVASMVREGYTEGQEGDMYWDLKEELA